MNRQSLKLSFIIMINMGISACNDSKHSAFSDSSSRKTAERGSPPTPAPTPAPPQPPTLPPIFDTKDVVEVKVKLGVNFEDGGVISAANDFDFNDAVLCFEGNFSFDKLTREVKSLKNQNVVANYARNADCQNHMLIEMIHADGEKIGPLDVTTPSGTVKKMDLTFKTGSILKVYLLAGDGCKNARNKIPMTDKTYTEVAVDKCNI